MELGNLSLCVFHEVGVFIIVEFFVSMLSSKKAVHSLAWPDRYFSAGAYRLEIISTRTEKGLSSSYRQVVLSTFVNTWSADHTYVI